MTLIQGIKFILIGAQTLAGCDIEHGGQQRINEELISYLCFVH
jgi:hypothetical protein